MVRKLLPKQLAGTDPYKGPMGKEPGILVYGPFTYPIDLDHALLDKREYRIHAHSTNDCNVLNFFALGGPGFKGGI